MNSKIAPALTSVTDPARLDALARTQLLDSPAEEAFDRLTRLAKRVLAAPVVLVSLVDDHRQFFKSAVGLPEPWASCRETPLSHSFCQHVVGRGEPLIVSDARLHPLVSDNLAIPDLGVIAYAGIPLVMPDGYVLGAFAAIDSAPRLWSDEDLMVLRDMAAAVITEAELRTALAESRRQADAARYAETQLRASELRLRVLCEITAESTLSFEEKVDGLLYSICQHLKLDSACFTESADTAAEARIVRCVALSGRRESPTLQELGEPCIQADIRVGSGRYGQLCFFPRSGEMPPASLADQEFVRLAAQWLGGEIERRRAEAALSESRERYKLAVRGTRDGLWDWNILDGTIYYSPRWKEILGYQPEELPSTHATWENRLHPEDRARVLAALETHVTGRSPEYQVEYRLRHKDGTYRWVLARGIALRDENGTPVRMAGSHSDITERKAAEEERTRLVRQAQEARSLTEYALAKAEEQAQLLKDQSKELARARDEAVVYARTRSEFLANMSHEIRTPMNGVLGMTGLLLDTPLTTIQREFAECTRASASALLNVINSILDFSKIESGKMTLDETDFEVRTLVEETVALLAPPAQEKDLELTCRVLPADGPIVLRGDDGRLRQVLINLLGNAVKFTEQGNVMVEVTVADDPDPAYATLRFVVSDTGIGIPRDRQSAVFESFVQVDGSMTRRYGGTGLGLAITEQLIRLMGGKIQLESEPGQGSIFTAEVRLPRGNIRTAGLELGVPSGLDGTRILVVDDNAVNRRILTEQLAGWGCTVEMVSSGAAALERLDTAAAGRDAFAAVLLDMQMPEMDGLEVARRIRKSATSRQLPLVLLSSGHALDTAASADLSLFAATLMKPARQSALLAALQRVLSEGSTPEPESAAFNAARDAGPAGASATTSAPAAAFSLTGLHILLAEDNVVNQKVAVNLLRKWGCRVTVAENGRLALDALFAMAQNGEPIDAVLMDVQMPEMDGLTATRQIRTRGDRAPDGVRPLPIIALTAHSLRGDRERCLDAGMDDYLSKPLQEAALRVLLERWCPLPSTPSVSIPPAPAVWASAAESSGNGTATKEKRQPEEPEKEERPLLRRESLWLSCGDDPELVVEVVAEFLRAAPDMLGRLIDAIADFDSGRVRFEAHTLRGSCRTIGAESLAETCSEMEQRAHENDIVGAGQLVEQAQMLLDRLRPVLKAEAGEPATV